MVLESMEIMVRGLAIVGTEYILFLHIEQIIVLV